jgi:hypothetical protein
MGDTVQTVSVPPIPYRIRIGVVVAEGAGMPPALGSFAGGFRETVLGLFDGLPAGIRDDRFVFSVLFIEGGAVGLAVATALGEGVPARLELVRAGKRRDRAKTFLIQNSDVLLHVSDPAVPVDVKEAGNRPVLRLWDQCTVHSRAAGLYGAGVKELEAFNRLSVPAAEAEKRAGKFLPGKDDQSVVPCKAHVDLLRKWIAPNYVRASRTAENSQDWYVVVGCLAYFLSVFAIVAGSFKHWLAPLAEVVCLLSILAAKARLDQWRDAWVQHRFFTERMRCMGWATLCGVPLKPIEVPPHLGRANSSNDWMVRAFEEIRTSIKGLYPRFDRQLRTFVCKQWLDGQIAHHRDGAEKRKKYQEWLERVGQAGSGSV